jgi:hypothetical protein
MVASLDDSQSVAVIERIVSQCYLVTKRLQWNTETTKQRAIARRLPCLYLGMHELYYRTDSKKWIIEGGEK